MSHYEVHDPRFDPPGMPPEEPFEEERRGRGCLFWGCLITAILLLLLVLTVVVGGYFAAQYFLNNFTTDQPANIEVVELPPERLAEIEARVEAFEAALQADGPDADPEALNPAALNLELTAEELNGLIHQDPDLRGKVFLRIENGRVGGEVSVPADKLPGGKGRYFNASAEFDVSLQDGELTVYITDAQVNGISMPPKAVDHFANKNFAEGIDQEPETRKLLEKFDSLEVGEDRIILRAKPPAGPEAEVAGEIESFEKVN